MYPISSIPGSKTFGIPGNPWLESSILLCIPSDTQPFSATALTKLLPEVERLSPWKFSLKENKTQFGSAAVLPRGANVQLQYFNGQKIQKHTHFNFRREILKSMD